MALLEARLSRMETAFDKNTDVFHNGIQMLEIQQSVLFRITQDVYNGQVMVKAVTTDDEGRTRATVDIQGYIQEHLNELQKLEEAPKEETSAAPVLSSPSDDAPIVFGGDA